VGVERFAKWTGESELVPTIALASATTLSQQQAEQQQDDQPWAVNAARICCLVVFW